MATTRLEKDIARFRAADRDTRLETLLDLSASLPPLPERLTSDRDREAHRVAECQTPVFLWLEREDGVVRLYADVPRESPTVRGFVSLLVRGLDGAPVEAVTGLPDDLLHELRLDETLGMVRTRGLGAVLRRLKAMAAG